MSNNCFSFATEYHLNATMETASIHHIKNEVKHLEKVELIELCLKLAKFKKENKELLSYLLFEADDENHFVATIKQDISVAFESINTSSTYLIKKSARRILKETKKYIRYSKKVETEIELLLHFCTELSYFETELMQSVVLGNMYRTQLNMLRKSLSKVHEDLQSDYAEAFERLDSHIAMRR